NSGPTSLDQTPKMGPDPDERYAPDQSASGHSGEVEPEAVAWISPRCREKQKPDKRESEFEFASCQKLSCLHDSRAQCCNCLPQLVVGILGVSLRPLLTHRPETPSTQYASQEPHP